MPCTTIWYYLRQVEVIRSAETARNIAEAMAGSPFTDKADRARILRSLDPPKPQSPEESYAYQKKAFAKLKAIMGNG